MVSATRLGAVAAAIGLAITFGVMGVINMAHAADGHLAPTRPMSCNSDPERRACADRYGLVFAIPAAFLVSGLAGIAIERCIHPLPLRRPWRRSSRLGLSLVLQQAIAVARPQQPRESPIRSGCRLDGCRRVGHDYNRFWITGSRSWSSPLNARVRKTSFGLRMRRVTQNRRMAASMGISTGLDRLPDLVSVLASPLSRPWP